MVHNISACSDDELRAGVPAPPTPSAPDLVHGSTEPPVSGLSPVPTLKFDGVDYVHGGYAEVPSGRGTVFVINGTQIDGDDLEPVGTTHEGNTSGIRDGLTVRAVRWTGSWSSPPARYATDWYSVVSGIAFTHTSNAPQTRAGRARARRGVRSPRLPQGRGYAIDTSESSSDKTARPREVTLDRRPVHGRQANARCQTMGPTSTASLPSAFATHSR